MNTPHLISTKLRDVKKTHLALAFLLALGFVTSIVRVYDAHAAAMTNTLVRFDQITTSTATTGTVCAKPATASTEAHVKVTFPTGYTVSGTVGNWTVNTTNTGWPSGATAWLGIGTATAATSGSGGDATFPSSDLVVGTLYCFNWTNTAAVSTQSSTSSSNQGTVVTQDSGPSTIDTGNYNTPTVSADSIAVSATVPTGFSYTLTGTTDNLGSLDAVSVKTSPTKATLTISTNAANGWNVWASDTQAGLHSNTASHTIASNCSGGVGSNATLSSGTEGYNFGVDKNSGTGTVATVFDRATTNYKGGGLCTANQTIASDTGLSSGTVLWMYNSAAISGSTAPATDYADTETITGAGLF